MLTCVQGRSFLLSNQTNAYTTLNTPYREVSVLGCKVL